MDGSEDFERTGEQLRILHTGDLHFGASLGGFSLLAEQEAIVSELLALVERERIGAALLTGDIFDRAVASGEAIELYDRFLTALCGKCPVYLIAGNHDGAARLASLAGLLRGAGLFVQGSLRMRPAPIRQENVEFWLIPYFHINQARSLYPEAGIRSVNDAMRVMMDDVRARRDPDAVTVVVAHCLVDGAVICESDTAAAAGGAGRVSPEVFEGIPYIALGHLHQAQQPAPNIRYAGSPYPYSFSEGEKTATVFDTESGEILALPMKQERTLRTVCGRYDEILAQPPSEDYLKIELTDRDAGPETLNALRARFPRLVMLLGRQGRAAAEAEAPHLPEEMIARFCEEIGGVPAEEPHMALFMELLEEVREGGAGQ